MVGELLRNHVAKGALVMAMGAAALGSAGCGKNSATEVEVSPIDPVIYFAQEKVITTKRVAFVNGRRIIQTLRNGVYGRYPDGSYVYDDSIGSETWINQRCDGDDLVTKTTVWTDTSVSINGKPGLRGKTHYETQYNFSGCQNDGKLSLGDFPGQKTGEVTTTANA